MVDSIAAQRLAYCLEPVLDLRVAVDLREQLLKLVAEQKPLTIDASQVSRISTACVQVLTAFAIATRNAGLPLAFEPISPVANAAFMNLGLAWVISEDAT